MLGSKLSQYRQTLDMSSSLKGTNNIPQNRGGKRQSDHQNNGHQNYDLDVELSDNKKKMLEAFKKSSGIMNTLAKKSETNTLPNFSQVIPSKVDQSTSLKEDTKIQNIQKKQPPLSTICEEIQRKQKDSLCLSVSKDRTPLTSTFNFSVMQSIGSHSEKDIQQFVRQVFEILGLASGDDSKMKLEYLLASAYTRFVDMKSNGRWKLIEDYFKADCDNLVETQTRSIIKKKSIISLSQVNLDKKRVRVIQPERSSQLEIIYSNLQHDLDAWVRSMTNGFQFIRYIDKNGKIQKGNLYFTYDLKMFSWVTPGKKQVIEHMKKFKKILEGSESNYFSKLQKVVRKIDQDLTFSLVFQEETYNLSAETKLGKQYFIMILREMRNFY